MQRSLVLGDKSPNTFSTTPKAIKVVREGVRAIKLCAENTSRNKSQRIMRLKLELCKPKSFDSRAEAGKSFYAPATRNELEKLLQYASCSTCCCCCPCCRWLDLLLPWWVMSRCSSPVCIHFSLSTFNNKNASKVSLDLLIFCNILAIRPKCVLAFGC